MEPAGESPRSPRQEDLLKLCRALNSEGAEYVVVGGLAVIRLGLSRLTDDIDLLIEDSPENIARVRRALEVLPDRAVREMADDDLENYTVVRIADEVVVDLMRSACGIGFDEAEREIELVTIKDIEIPFASARLLHRMKQTGREQDRLDLLFLEEKLRESKKPDSQ